MDYPTIEFTTTACNRPELLEKTYLSFSNNLIGIYLKKCTLYINIDPSPNSTNIKHVEEIANKYFGNVIANYPQEPNFASAIIWCFSQIKHQTFFHLEDDWILNYHVNLPSLLHTINNNDKIHQYMLEKTDQSNEPAFVPSLHKTRIMRLFLPHMVSYLNPEAQMKKLYRYWASNHLYQFTYLALGKGIVSDIGRDWLLSKGIKRDYEKTKKYGSSKWSPWISWET